MILDSDRRAGYNVFALHMILGTGRATHNGWVPVIDFAVDFLDLRHFYLLLLLRPSRGRNLLDECHLVLLRYGSLALLLRTNHSKYCAATLLILISFIVSLRRPLYY